jgi:hypothetical protein
MKKLFYRMKKKTNFYLYFVDAKLQRFKADSKKLRQFFFNLCGQTNDLWTYRGNRPLCCPDLNKKQEAWAHYKLKNEGNRIYKSINKHRKNLCVSEIVRIFAPNKTLWLVLSQQPSEPHEITVQVK